MSTQRQGPHTVIELVRLTTTYLAAKGLQTARLDAEVLLAHCLGVDRVGLYINYDRPLEPAEVNRYRELVARRGRREPVAYITGEKEFMSRDFLVSPAVLIPRPETELLVEAVTERLGASKEKENLPLLDVGTGSGVIAVSLASQFPNARVTAVDISPQALAVAKANAERHGVAQRVAFVESNLFAGLRAGESFHCIVSNPPYIPEGDITQLEPELQMEPRLALAAGPDGLSIVRALLRQAAAWLKPGGFIALEIGAGQGQKVQEAALASGFNCVEVRKDYAGHDRVVLVSGE